MQENAQEVVGLRDVLGAHNAEVMDVPTMLEHPHAPFPPFGRVPAQAIHAPLGSVAHARHIQKVLRLKLSIEVLSQEQPQRVFGALLGA